MQKKYRTKTSKALDEFVESRQGKCFSAARVSKYLKEQDIEVNLTTVYRNLDKLVDEGRLVRFKATNSDTYSYRENDEHTHCDEHFHMQCKKCGRVIHLEDDIMKKIATDLCAKYDFAINYKDSSISGICGECRAEHEKK
ncbi:Fur family transcriptional regulator, ferric uptake regulator [Lachnospiraceae bacterium C7]|nr:Fur family transcriptional regulator, ferric uptake regulator [Lachnospiraceae bacterium C7]